MRSSFILFGLGRGGGRKGRRSARSNPSGADSRTFGFTFPHAISSGYVRSLYYSYSIHNVHSADTPARLSFSSVHAILTRRPSTSAVRSRISSPTSNPLTFPLVSTSSSPPWARPPEEETRGRPTMCVFCSFLHSPFGWRRSTAKDSCTWRVLHFFNLMPQTELYPFCRLPNRTTPRATSVSPTLLYPSSSYAD